MRTKQMAQDELNKIFGVKDTNGIKKLLTMGKVEEAAKVVNYVYQNLPDFPQYDRRWVCDRRSEIEVAHLRQKKAENQPRPKRSKGEAQEDLFALFGFADTAGFREALKNGDMEIAQSFLEYIKSDPCNFPQHLDTWDNWLADREAEIKKASAD